MKKGLALILGLMILLMGSIAVGEDAPEERTSENWTYIVQEDGTA